MKRFLHTVVCDRFWIAVLGLWILQLSAPSVWADRVILTGGLINMTSDTHTKATESFTVLIDHLTPDADYDALVARFRQKGQTGLQDAMWDLKPVGQIRIGTSLGYPLAVARASVEGGRRVLRILTDRSLQFYEVMHALRTRDYPFSYIEITLDAQGSGEGNFIPVAKVAFKKNGDIDVTNYTALPFKMIHVKQEIEERK